MEVSGQRHAPAVLPLWENLCIHCREDWLCPKSVLDNFEEIKSLSHRIRTAVRLVAKRLREFQFPDIMYDIIVK